MGKPRKILPVGAVYGQLTVLECLGCTPQDGVHYSTVCTCGVVTSVAGRRMLSGRAVSCGCAAGERHGMTGGAVYEIWKGMHTRCRSQKHKSWKDYGGRGIKVCARWARFSVFAQDMGPRPSPRHTIDRRDNDGDYSPENCIWATRLENMQHTRKSVYTVFDGAQMTLAEAARKSGIPYKVLQARAARVVKALPGDPDIFRPYRPNQKKELT